MSIVADHRIQQELDGATRNKKIYQEISERMASLGFTRSMTQCREKLKKMKSDYRATKDHNGRSGADRRCWRWFEAMDAIYGHRPASRGRESSLDSAAALLQTSESGECFVTLKTFPLFIPLAISSLETKIKFKVTSLSPVADNRLAS